MLPIAIIVGVVVVTVWLFAVAELIFKPAGAILLAGGVGYGFGGPPGAGVGLVIGLVLTVITAFLGVMMAPTGRSGDPDA